MTQQAALFAIDLYVIFGRNVLKDPLMNYWLSTGVVQVWGGNDSLEAFYVGQWIVTLIHLILMGLQAGTEIFKVKAFAEISTAAGLLLNLLWMILLGKMWWAYPYDWFKQFKKFDGKNYVDIDNKEWDADVALSTEMWIFIEVANVCGLKLTNMLFLMIRSCTRNKLTFDSKDDREQLANTETVKALKPVINSFNTNWVPLVVAITVKADRVPWVMESIFLTTSVNALFSTVLIFVHW